MIYSEDFIVHIEKDMYPLDHIILSGLKTTILDEIQKSITNYFKNELNIDIKVNCKPITNCENCKHCIIKEYELPDGESPLKMFYCDITNFNVNSKNYCYLSENKNH